MIKTNQPIQNVEQNEQRQFQLISNQTFADLPRLLRILEHLLLGRYQNADVSVSHSCNNVVSRI
jgi:hypothetical protein